jgi:hypothetical protein
MAGYPIADKVLDMRTTKIIFQTDGTTGGLVTVKRKDDQWAAAFERWDEAMPGHSTWESPIALAKIIIGYLDGDVTPTAEAVAELAGKLESLSK